MKAITLALLAVALSLPMSGLAAVRVAGQDKLNSAWRDAPVMPHAFLKQALESRMPGARLSLVQTDEGLAAGADTTIDVLEGLAGLLPDDFEIVVSIDGKRHGILAAISSAPSLTRVRLGTRTRLRLERRFYFTVRTADTRRWLLGHSLPAGAVPFEQVLIRRTGVESLIPTASSEGSIAATEVEGAGSRPESSTATPTGSPANLARAAAWLDPRPTREPPPTISSSLGLALAPTARVDSPWSPPARDARRPSPANQRHPDATVESPWLPSLARRARTGSAVTRPTSIAATALPKATLDPSVPFGTNPTLIIRRVETVAAPSSLPAPASTFAMTALDTATPPVTLLLGVAGLVAWRRRASAASSSSIAIPPELTRAVDELVQSRAAHGQDLDHHHALRATIRLRNAGPAYSAATASRARQHIVEQLEAVIVDLHRRGNATGLRHIESFLARERSAAIA